MLVARNFSSSVLVLVGAIAVALFGCATSLAVPKKVPPSSRIIGGVEAASGAHAYAVSVRLNNAHICGGSIIGNKFILTAAHCLEENGHSVAVSQLSVRVGTTNQYAGGAIIQVTAKTIHPQYKHLDNNIAILTLATSLQWSDKIQSINIATDPAESAPVGAQVIAVGWGKQVIDSEEAPYKQHSLEFKVSTADVCKNAYQEMDSTTLCLDHGLKEGSCSGDAGNGAIYQGRLVGIANFIVGSCGSRYPDVFLDVTSYAKWISSIVG